MWEPALRLKFTKSRKVTGVSSPLQTLHWDALKYLGSFVVLLKVCSYYLQAVQKNSHFFFLCQRLLLDCLHFNNRKCFLWWRSVKVIFFLGRTMTFLFFNVLEWRFRAIASPSVITECTLFAFSFLFVSVIYSEFWMSTFGVFLGETEIFFTIWKLLLC